MVVWGRVIKGKPMKCYKVRVSYNKLPRDPRLIPSTLWFEFVVQTTSMKRDEANWARQVHSYVLHAHQPYYLSRLRIKRIHQSECTRYLARCRR